VLRVTTNGVTMGSRTIQKFTWILISGCSKRPAMAPFDFMIQKINLALNLGSASMTVFSAEIPMKTSMTMDNNASRHQGYHQAMTSAHKSIGSLMPILHSKTHMPLVVHQVCKTCRLVNVMTLARFSFFSGGCLRTIQSGTNRDSYPCSRNALYIFMSSVVMELPPCPLICRARFAFSNTFLGMASPPPHI